MLTYVTESGKVIIIQTSNGSPICNGSSEELSVILKDFRNVSTYNERLIITHQKGICSLSFSNWNEMIYNNCKDGDYKRAFNQLYDVLLNNNTNFFGIPKNFAIRRKQVIELGKELLKDYFNSIINNENEEIILNDISSITEIILKINLNEYLINDIFQMFKEKHLENVYFNGIFKGIGDNFLKIFTKEFLENYLSYSNEQQKLEEAENKLIEFKYDKLNTISIIPIILKYKLLKLFKKICLDKERNDFLLCLCNYYYEKNKLWEFINPFFSEEADIGEYDIIKKMIIIWLMVPNEKNQFIRLSSLLSCNWREGVKFVQAVMAMLPIKYDFSNFLRMEHLFEAILQILSSRPYADAKPYLNVILPLYPTLLLQFGSDSLKHIVKWIFSSVRISPTTREEVLKIFLNQYPDCIPEKELMTYCEKAGFISFITKHYLPMKDYSKIIQLMISHKANSSTLFEFIENNLKDTKEMRYAITTNISQLILVNPTRMIQIINQNFPDLHDEIIENLRDTRKLAYLNAYLDTTGSTSMNPKWLISIFKLKLRYNPSEAVHFLVDHIEEINIDEAQAASKNRIDCQVQILIFRRQYKEAIEQIGNEIERTLLEFIESDSDIAPDTIDELDSIKQLNAPMNCIRTAINLLETTDSAPLQWQKMFLYFQFPIYHSSTKSDKPNISTTIILMFSYFMIASLNKITAFHLFYILTIYFSFMNQNQYREVMTNIILRINYEKNLYKGLDELLISDCIELIEKANHENTKGTEVINYCAICKKHLSKAGDLVEVFPCGHAVHKNCAGDANKCPVCSGLLSPAEGAGDDTGTSKLSTRRVQQLMRRMEFSLKKNFNATSKKTQKNSVYFAPLNDYNDFQIALTEVEYPNVVIDIKKPE